MNSYLIAKTPIPQIDSFPTRMLLHMPACANTQQSPRGYLIFIVIANICGYISVIFYGAGVSVEDKVEVSAGVSVGEIPGVWVGVTARNVDRAGLLISLT